MRILIVRFSALGDLILITGPMRALKKLRPDIEIHLLTSPMGAELLQNSLEISKIYVVDKGASFGQLITTYRNLPKFDFIFDLQGKLNSKLIRLTTSAPISCVEKQSRERRSFVKNRKHKDKLTKHIVEKYYDCFAKFLDLEPMNVEALRPVLYPNKLTYDRDGFDFSKAVVIHPYASQNNKLWPYFKELINKLTDSSQPVVIIGSHNGNTHWGDMALNLSNKTSINEMISIVNEAKTLISTDSGPMHIGIATKTPTLAIFGPTTKEFGFYPVFESTKVVEHSNLDCRPCHVHGGNECPLKHFKCMKEISVEQVLKALASL